MIDEDIIQRIKVAGIFLLQVYKVTTGTMLSLFIPQSCSIDDADSVVDSSASMVNDGSRICSLKENFEELNKNSGGYRIITGANLNPHYIKHLRKIKKEKKQPSNKKK